MHEHFGRFVNFFEFRILHFREDRFDHGKHDELRFLHDIKVTGERFEGTVQVVVATEFPGSVDDLFLKFEEFTGVSLLLAGLSGLGLAFADDFLEETDFGKKHVTGGAADFAFAVEVFGPEVVRDEIARLGTEFLDVDEGGKLMRLLSGERFFREDNFGFLFP